MGVLFFYRFYLLLLFYNCVIDIFGLFIICDMVKKWIYGKVYGVLFNCFNCRGVYIDLVEGYDIGNFIVVFRRFVFICGNLKWIIFDVGI